MLPLYTGTTSEGARSAHGSNWPTKSSNCTATLVTLLPGWADTTLNTFPTTQEYPMSRLSPVSVGFTPDRTERTDRPRERCSSSQRLEWGQCSGSSRKRLSDCLIEGKMSVNDRQILFFDKGYCLQHSEILLIIFQDIKRESRLRPLDAQQSRSTSGIRRLSLLGHVV